MRQYSIISKSGRPAEAGLAAPTTISDCCRVRKITGIETSEYESAPNSLHFSRSASSMAAKMLAPTMNESTRAFQWVRG